MIDPIFFTLKFIFDFWWLIFPTLMIQILWEKFKDNQRAEYRKKINWSFLELKFPTGITRTPRAMEEVFNALHGIFADPLKDLTWYNINIKGFVPSSYTLLIIAHDSQLRFYLRFQKELKEFVKTRIYSQYPEIQFEEINNPLEELPSTIPNSLFDLEIFDVRLTKEDSYPIKTYTLLEHLPEEQQIDPITTFSEAATQISNKEWLIFQILTLPVDTEESINAKKWVERGKKLINKLIGKEEKKERSILEEVEEFVGNLLLAPFREPVWTTEEKKEQKEFNIQKLTPGERKIIESIQTKISKVGYWTNIRAVYLASRSIFNLRKKEIEFLIKSIFKNFSTEDLNGFNVYRLTPKEGFTGFILKRLEYSSFQRYRPITLPQNLASKLKSKNLDKGFILNSEELASLFHPPMEFVPPIGIEKIPLREFPPPDF